MILIFPPIINTCSLVVIYLTEPKARTNIRTAESEGVKNKIFVYFKKANLSLSTLGRDIG
jgi:hypothetical protein